MANAERPTFALTMGEVSLKAPETPLYLNLAAQVLEARRRELEDDTPQTVASPAAPSTPAAEAAAPPQPTSPATTFATDAPVAPQTPLTSPPPAQVTLVHEVSPIASPPAAPASIAPSPVARRPRWFRDRMPRVTFADGSMQVMESLEALRTLLRQRGLQPHPRGDASMIIWQVRNRLGLEVDVVEVPSAAPSPLDA